MFYDSKFPINGVRPKEDFFLHLHKNITIVDAEGLATALVKQDVDCLINLHGPYFPKDAWYSIVNFLSKGKGLVHIGGVPFRIPCYKENEIWIREREQTAYHQQLNIHEALDVSADPIASLKHYTDIPLFKGREELFSITDTYNFILHVTKKSSIEKEMGSVGPMDAHIYPLLKGISKTGREVAAPSVLIENTKGRFTGGRWVFINQVVDEKFWSAKGAELLGTIVKFTQHGVTEMWLKMNYATYELDERPNVTFQVQSLLFNETDWTLTFTVTNGDKEYAAKTASLTATHYLQRYSFVIEEDLEPGLYHVICHAESTSGEIRILRQGFWKMDRQLLQEGELLTYDRDYFWKDGRPMPIVGMTYMTSDVSRYFLFLPNPDVWDHDMAQMKRAGINYIRTGVWTAWRNMMFIDGHVDEMILRSIDAFLLCAKKHDLHVTFTFFTFTPEMWEGENPYLDPRSVAAQKRFISSIVSRHIETTNVDWDLINEPSMFDPDRTFAGPRSVHDRFERKAYQDWLKERYTSIREVQERWNMTVDELPSFEAIEPPEIEAINLGVRDMASGKKGLRLLDYTLFTNAMHNRWANELVQMIKELAPNQLVTVGQDEALAGQRPSALFYNEVVDYTSNHTWWLLDDLVWDGIFTKTPNKPNLIQETGIMYVEQPNNRAKRSEEELHRILERKYAYAFSTGAAGAVQWVWNTNFYMNNINESNIGAIRADGTEKPETNVSYQFGQFMNDIRDLFQGRELEEVSVVFPYSNDFSNRKFAYDATTQATRVLAYELNVPFRAVGEYHLHDVTSHMPKLLILPSAHNVENDAFEQLLTMVKEAGTTLLVTGPINLDAYWQETDRLENELGKTVNENVVREEYLDISNQFYTVSFGRERIGEVLKGNTLAEDTSGRLTEFSYGKGTIIWCPIPVELNERSEPIKALYSYAMEKAAVKKDFEWLEGNASGIYGRKLSFERGDLYIFVSEYSRNTQVKIKDLTTEAMYTFLLEKERTVMFAVDNEGQVLSIYRPDEVEIRLLSK